MAKLNDNGDIEQILFKAADKLHKKLASGEGEYVLTPVRYVGMAEVED